MKREGLTRNRFSGPLPANSTRVIVDHVVEHTCNPEIEQCVIDDIMLRNQVIDGLKTFLHTRERALAVLDELDERGFKVVSK